MPSINEIKEILELILMLGAALAVVLSPWVVSWGKKHLGVAGHELRIGALEAEDISIRSRLAKNEEEISRLVKSDKRVYKIALLLAQEFPESAKNINLLEDL